MMYQVKDLSPDQKLAIEGLLGRSVSEDEAVALRAFAPAEIIPSTLTSEQRQQAIEALSAYFAKVDSRRKPVTDEEEQAITTAAIRSVRPSYRPLD